MVVGRDVQLDPFCPAALERCADERAGDLRGVAAADVSQPTW